MGHGLLRCDYNKEVSEWMVPGLEWDHPAFGDFNILFLNVDIQDSDHSGLAFVWFAANVLQTIFQCPCNLGAIQVSCDHLGLERANI